MNIITPSEVVEYAFSPREEISPGSIRPTKIDIAAEHFVRPRFGDELYERFLGGEYLPFVDEYVKPALAHYVRYVMVDDISIQLTDNGAVVFENEELQSQHSKQTASQGNENSNQNASQKSSSTQQSNDSQHQEQTTKSTLVADTRGSDSSQGTSQSVESKSDDTATTQITGTTTHADTNSATDTKRTTNDTTTTKLDKQRDYQFHESPQTVGVSTIGESNDRSDQTRTLVGGYDQNQSLTQEGVTKVDQDSNQTKVSKIDADTKLEKSSSTESTKSTDQTTEQNRTSEESSQGSRTTSGDQISKGELTKSSTHRALDDGSAQTARRQLRPATDFQRRIIRARALADANILMSKAVRYVERNSELFPQYKPLPRSVGRLVL